MAYEIQDGDAPQIERHTMAVLVDNEPGVLARVVGLFSGRGYNIESLTVSSVSEDETVSRISLVTTGTPMIIEQIKAQLNRLIPVNAVHDLTEEGPHIERELALIKLAATGPQRRESLRLADIFRARVADTTTESFVFVLTGSKDKIDSFTDLMRDLGEVEVARSGAVAIARGAKLL
jgi:acetolactate synthase-1/3 small subunit